MQRQARKAARWLAGTAVAGGLLAGGFGFSASNTVPDLKAGDGTGTVTGYVLTSVSLNLNASNPGNVDSVTFDLDSTPAAGSTMKVQLVSGGSWYSCTNVAAAVTCDTSSPQATVTPTDQLRVVVAD